MSRRCGEIGHRRIGKKLVYGIDSRGSETDRSHRRVGGGIETLRALAAGFPAEFDTPICIVMHMSPESPGTLHEILDRAGRLPAVAVRNGDRLRGGRIYVAPPDCHLVVEPGAPASHERTEGKPEVEVRIAKEQNALEAGLERVGDPSSFACPECHGVLLQLEESQHGAGDVERLLERAAEARRQSDMIGGLRTEAPLASAKP